MGGGGIFPAGFEGGEARRGEEVAEEGEASGASVMAADRREGEGKGVKAVSTGQGVGGLALRGARPLGKKGSCPGCVAEGWYQRVPRESYAADSNPKKNRFSQNSKTDPK